jgi:hypothetical protein
MGHHDDEKGRFSTGQERRDATADLEHRGDYAEGQEGEHTPDDLRRGDYAEGQEELPHSHARPSHGDFAEGQEREPHD